MIDTQKLKFAGAAALAVIVMGATTFDASAQRSARCDAYARDYANRSTGGGAGGGAVRGGIGGALGGAVIGSIFGGRKGAGRGAVIGGGIGILGGAAHGDAEWRNAYHYAYNDCVRGRVTPVSARPAPWTPEWYDYCARKFRSFNPDTGKYLSFSGEYRLCR
jgi:hypothetical protein